MKIVYRPEIDGLRAIAVIAVILYHAQIIVFESKPFKGGFIGVDIFFVISGYLITSIILKELVSTGTFSFKYFYERRIRRILPILLFIILVSLPFAWYHFLPSSLIDFSKSIIYSLGFGSNFYFHYSGQQYAAESGLLKPFLHTWSLSVEEQYYILFPIVLLITYKYIKKYLLTILIIGLITSLQFADWGSRNYPSASFYFIHTRMWELIAGSILAYFEMKFGHRGKNKMLKLTMPSTGLILISYSILFFNEEMFHPSFYTLPPIIGICLIIWFANKDEIITKILSTKIFNGIGLISYSLYLWHYPIFAFFRINEVFFDNLLFKLSVILLSLILSIFSYKFIEKPFRNKNFNFKKVISIILSMATIIIIFNLFIILSNGAKERVEGFKFSDELFGKTNSLIINNTDDSCFESPIGCEFNILSDKKIFVIGDSLINNISLDLNNRLLSKGYHTNFFYLGDCLYFPEFNRVLKGTNIIDEKCNNEYFSRIKDKIDSNKDSIVIFFGRFTLQLSNLRFDNKEGGLEKNDLRWEYDLISNSKITREISFINSINEISKFNKVIFLYPLPEVGWKVKEIIREINISPKTFSTSYDVFKERNKISFTLLDSINNKNIHRIYPHKLFCGTLIKNRCIVHNNSSIFYNDSIHLSKSGAKMVNNLIIKEIEKIEDY